MGLIINYNKLVKTRSIILGHKGGPRAVHGKAKVVLLHPKELTERKESLVQYAPHHMH